MWYIGLNWADTHHDVEVMDEAGKRVGARRFPHSYQGLNELKQCVVSIAVSPEHLACIVETNHGLLITFLLEAGIPVFRRIQNGQSVAQNGRSQDRSNRRAFVGEDRSL